MGEAVLSQMHPLLAALRSSADARSLSVHEKALAKKVRKELARVLRDLRAELSHTSGDEVETKGRKPRSLVKQGERQKEPSDKEQPQITGRKNQPRTPAPDAAVGRLRRTLVNMKGLPKVEVDTWDSAVRSVTVDEGKGRTIKVNAAYPMYRLSGASKAYLAETILLEVLQADPDVATKQDLVSQLDLMLRRWSQHLEADQSASPEPEMD